MEILCGILWAIILLINLPILNNFSHQLQVDMNTLICYKIEENTLALWKTIQFLMRIYPLIIEQKISMMP